MSPGLVGICSSLVGASWAADKDQSDIAKRIDVSAKVLDEIMATPDKAIPDKVMRKAKCIAVIPSMVKIAIGFGGNHGKGVATCRTESGLERPAPYHDHRWKLGSATWGSSGRSRHDRTNDQGMEHLLSSKFKLGAEVPPPQAPWAET